MQKLEDIELNKVLKEWDEVCGKINAIIESEKKNFKEEHGKDIKEAYTKEELFRRNELGAQNLYDWDITTGKLRRQLGLEV